MSTLRVGLKHVSNNSPALSLLHKKGNLQAALPQLSKTLQIKAPTEENKENSTQIPEAELQSSSTQTVISVLKQDIAITKEDLTSDTPSVSYWRGMVETFERDAESELERSFNFTRISRRSRRSRLSRWMNRIYIVIKYGQCNKYSHDSYQRKRDRGKGDKAIGLKGKLTGAIIGGGTGSRTSSMDQMRRIGQKS
uniref:Uncharacterized protein n=1 Tax=Heterorhabditis bacteriophora TaxID=37862 RepID=A0A1I7WUT0_HETBA